jgi:hypothetical protein
MPRGKKELAEQIIPKVREVEVGVVCVRSATRLPNGLVWPGETYGCARVLGLPQI